MKATKKIFVMLLAVVMAATVCSSALAEGAGMIARKAADAAAYRLMDDAWAPINQVEREMIALGAQPHEIVTACYKAALTNSLVDEGSVLMCDDNGFQFTVDGMANAYDYRVRNTKFVSSVTDELVEDIMEANAVRVAENVKANANTSTSLNVLLIGPMYSSDSSFTTQYQTEGTSINNYTGGTYTKLLNENATATAIVNAFPNNGVIMFDSHGASYYSTSYLCLCTSTGITSSDYSKYWALNFGDGETYGIDGRFIRNHASSDFPNNFVWMAICEGMKTSVFGTNLTAKGAAAVYGYSQSVTFAWDYKCEKAFWTKMKQGATIASSITYMRSQCGSVDPYGSDKAYPVVVSATDSYPSNPDSVQTVTCDWVLPSASLIYTAVTSVSVSPASATLPLGRRLQLTGTVNPSDANSYTESWSSNKTNVATVSDSGLVTPVSTGTATITYRVVDTDDNGSTHTYTATCAVTVTDDVPEGDLYKLVSSKDEVTAGDYLIGAYDGSDYRLLSSETGHASGSLESTVATDLLYTPASGTYMVAPAAENIFTFAAKSIGYTVAQNGSYVYAPSSSNSLSMSTSSCVWVPSDYNGGVMLQKGNTSGYFMGLRFTGTYFYFQAYDTSYAENTGYFANLLLFKKVEDVVEPTYYTVTFKDWDGTVLSTQQVVEGGSATAPVTPERTGYTFTGWDKSFSNITANTVVTAQYSINSYTLTVRYQYADGTTAAPAYTGSYTYGAAYSVTSPVISGFTASIAVVEGVMGDDDMTVTVTYTSNSGVLMGDVDGNGVLSFADVTMLYNYVLGGATIVNAAAADVDGNGNVGFEDVASLYQLVLGGN